MERLCLQLKGGFTVFSGPFFALYFFCLVLGLPCGQCVPWKCVYVWSKGDIKCVALFSGDVTWFWSVSLVLLSCLDAVKADGGPWERRDLRLEVALAVLRLAKLSLALSLAFVNIKLIFPCPETRPHGSFVGSSKLSLRLQHIGWVFQLILTLQLCVDTNCAWGSHIARLGPLVNILSAVSLLWQSLRLQDCIHCTTLE